MVGADLVAVVKDPKEAFQGMAAKGAATAADSPFKVFAQSFFAGCYIGFGALLATVIAGGLGGATENNPGLRTAVFAFLFPVNLVLILLTGGILFTGTSAAGPAAVYEGKTEAWRVALILVISWFGNVLGSLVFAYFTDYCELNVGSTKDFLMEIAVNKTKKNFGVTFAKGIGCNWMVCMAVFLCGQAQDMAGKVAAIYLPISTFVMCGFEHIPANFYLLELALITGDDVTFEDVLIKNWIPVTLGNFVAGAFIVAGGYSFFYGKLGRFDFLAPPKPKEAELPQKVEEKPPTMGFAIEPAHVAPRYMIQPAPQAVPSNAPRPSQKQAPAGAPKAAQEPVDQAPVAAVVAPADPNMPVEGSAPVMWVRAVTGASVNEAEMGV